MQLLGLVSHILVLENLHPQEAALTVDHGASSFAAERQEETTRRHRQLGSELVSKEPSLWRGPGIALPRRLRTLQGPETQALAVVV